MGKGSSMVGSLVVGAVSPVVVRFISTPLSSSRSHEVSYAEDPKLLSFLSVRVDRTVHDLARLRHER